MQREPDLNYTALCIISFGKWAILKGGGEEGAVQGRVVEACPAKCEGANFAWVTSPHYWPRGSITGGRN